MGECHTDHGNCSCPCHKMHHHEESCTEESHDDKMGWLLEAADSAWMEVLKEKIKDHIKATQNERLTELAKIVSEANSQRWKLKMEKKKVTGEFQEKLCGFFSSHSKK